MRAEAHPQSSQLDPRSVSLRARIARLGALVLHSRYDRRETTANGRAAFLSRFLVEVDPEGVLPETERHRRAEYAKKAYFGRLALRSAQVRAKRATPARVTGATLKKLEVSGGNNTAPPA